jgi:hypothetical protein
MADKEQINHDEKFKEMYAKRAEENSEKMHGENGIEAKASEGLVRFDNEEMRHYEGAEKSDLKDLEGREQQGASLKARLGEAIGELEGRIGKLDEQIKSIEDNAEVSIAEMKNREGAVAGRKGMAKVREMARVQRAKAIFEARNGIDAARVRIVELQSEI